MAEGGGMWPRVRDDDLKLAARACELIGVNRMEVPRLGDSNIRCRLVDMRRAKYPRVQPGFTPQFNNIATAVNMCYQWANK